jgi:hypothetical protein
LEGCRWGWFIVGAQLTFRQQGVCTAEDTSIVGAQLTWRVQSNTCVPTGTGYGPWCMYVRTYTQRCYSPAAMSRQPHSTIPQNIRSFLDEIVDQQTHHKLPAYTATPIIQVQLLIASLSLVTMPRIELWFCLNQSCEE